MQSLPLGPNDVVPWYRHVSSTGSTNADLLSATADLPVGALLVADAQTDGVGRRQRRWTSAAGTSIAMSILLDHADSWVPLIGGLALYTALRSMPTIIPAQERGALTLKWPNDVLFHGQKVAGILAQRASDDRVVLGTGINIMRRDLMGRAAHEASGASVNPSSHSFANVHETRDQQTLRAATRDLEADVDRMADQQSPEQVPLATPPRPTPPGILDIAGDEPGRSVRQLIAEYAVNVLRFHASLTGAPQSAEDAHNMASLRASYRAACQTIGQTVCVYPPSGEPWVGVATDIHRDGRLTVVDDDGASIQLAAEEIRHLRPASQTMDVRRRGMH